VPDVALPEKRRVGSSTLPLTTSFERGFSALTSADTQPARFDIMISEHDQAGFKAEETER
jgi:hypothetical protein